MSEEKPDEVKEGRRDEVRDFISSFFSMRSLEGVIDDLMLAYKKGEMSLEGLEQWLKNTCREMDYRNEQILKYGNDPIIRASFYENETKIIEDLAHEVIQYTLLNAQMEHALDRMDKSEVDSKQLAKNQEILKEAFKGLLYVFNPEARVHEVISNLEKMVGEVNEDAYRESRDGKGDPGDSK